VINITEILKYWSYWDRAIPVSVPRKIVLPERLYDQLALVIQGVRRCGKSTLLSQMIQHYGLNKQHCIFINFEDARLIAHLDSTLLDSVVEYGRKIHTKEQKIPLFFFFDEIQNVSGWERWLNTQLERPSGNHFIITSSNSSLLSGELATSLTGRYTVLELFPFDFSEFSLATKSIDAQEYLQRGGFPMVLMFHDSKQLLQQYFQDIVEKDIRERLGARSAETVKSVIKMLFESLGSELSLRKISGVVGVSVDTVQSYIAGSEQAYLVFKCPLYSTSERKRERSNIKYYPIDTALRRAVITPTGRDAGKDLELITFLSLRRRTKNIFYWKGAKEVDFVAQTDKGIFPIQVSSEQPKERHYKAVEEFFSSYPYAQNPIFVGLEDLQESFSCFDVL
jgi:uncharacterized protein